MASDNMSGFTAAASSCPPLICGCSKEAFEKMTLDEKRTACLNVYGVNELPEESTMNVEAVCLQLEKAIDALPDKTKAPYQRALEQEIQQGTDYVRNRSFLLMFLRCDFFDVRKAATRMANYFAYKLELFGLERLPHPIIQVDLDAQDIEVLLSGVLHFDCGTDIAGRAVMMSRRKQLTESGMWCSSRLKNIQRVCFYLAMKTIQNNVESQRKGVVCIIWNPDSSLSLKEIRMTLPLIKMFSRAMPIRGGGVHFCYNEPNERVGALWRYSVFPNYLRQCTRFHAHSITKTLKDLSRYGINVDNLPVGQNGEYHKESILCALEAEKQREGKNNPNNSNGKHIQFQLTNRNHVEKVGSAAERMTSFLSADKPSTSLENKTQAVATLSSNSSVVHGALAASHQLSEPKQKTTQPKPIVTTSIESSGESNESSACAFSTLSKYKAGGIGGSDEKLPVKLMNILQSNLFTNAIWWIQPKGDRFAIHKENFFQVVLQKHFHGTKPDSFLRSLRRWGFERLSSESTTSNVNIYRHQMFQRCSPYLVQTWTLCEGGQPKKAKLPVKLMKLLESQTAANAIWWLPDKTSFAIDTEKFAKDVLSNEFKITLDSFIRMMRRWEFKRLPQSKNPTSQKVISYKHPLFQKNAPELLANWNCLDALTKLGVGEKSSRPREGKFPLRLFKVLENNSARDAVWWLSSGDAFALESEKFQRLSLLKEFQGIKLTSFLRSLKRWGFRKMPGQLPTISIYHHPLFQQSSPELIEIFSNESKDNLHELARQLDPKDATAGPFTAADAAIASKRAASCNTDSDKVNSKRSAVVKSKSKIKFVVNKKLPLKKRCNNKIAAVIEEKCTVVDEDDRITNNSEQIQSQLQHGDTVPVVREEAMVMEIDQKDDSSQESSSPQQNTHLNQNQHHQQQHQALEQQRQKLQVIVQNQLNTYMMYLQQAQQANLQLEALRLTQLLQSRSNQETATLSLLSPFNNAAAAATATNALANLFASGAVAPTSNPVVNTSLLPSMSPQQVLLSMAPADTSNIGSDQVFGQHHDIVSMLQSQIMQSQLHINQLDQNANFSMNANTNSESTHQNISQNFSEVPDPPM